ncbi:hypothetical protein C1Y18_36260, partial [Pseudomonas sp. MPR-R5A]
VQGLGASGTNQGQLGDTPTTHAGDTNAPVYRDFAHLARVAKAFVANKAAVVAKSAEESGVGGQLDVSA